MFRRLQNIFTSRFFSAVKFQMNRESTKYQGWNIWKRQNFQARGKHEKHWVCQATVLTILYWASVVGSTINWGALQDKKALRCGVRQIKARHAMLATQYTLSMVVWAVSTSMSDKNYSIKLFLRKVYSSFIRHSLYFFNRTEIKKMGQWFSDRARTP